MFLKLIEMYYVLFFFCIDFKAFLEEQKAKAKGKRKKKNVVTARTAGFDLSDYRKPRKCLFFKKI